VTGSALAPLLDDAGLLIGLAFDHRDSLDALLADRGLGMPGTGAVRELKAAVVRAIAPAASAVMLDHDYGARAIGDGSLPAGVGLVMPLEAQGYAQLGDERPTTLMAAFTPADALRHGAAACKVLLPMRPDNEPFTTRQVATAARAAEAVHAAGLAIVMEPLVYRLEAEPVEGFRARYAGLVVAATARLAATVPDLLKLPFPVAGVPEGDGGVAAAADRAAADRAAADACAAMHAAAGGVPWVLYGAGAPEDAFARQLRIAGTAGACGFLVGRTVWGDALDPDPARTGELAASLGRPRFERFAAVAREACRPVEG
jgi:tagatose-1,6-bisphosphate aldolase